MEHRERIYHALYQFSREAVMTFDPVENNFLGGNPAAIALFGCSDEQQFKTLKPSDLSPEFQPDGQRSEDKAQEMMELAISQGSNFFEWTHRQMNGETFLANVFITCVDIDGKNILLATVRDITARKMVEYEHERLLNSEQAALRSITEVIDRVSDSFVSLDADWKYTYVNAKAAEIFGRKSEDLIGKHIWTEFPDGVGQKFHLAYEKAMTEQKMVFLEDYYPPFDRWFENRIYPSPDGLTIYFHDITSRKRAEIALRDREASYRAIFDQASVGIARVGMNGKWLEVNKKLMQIVGYSSDELLKMDFLALTHSNDLKANQEYHRDLLEGTINTYTLDKRYLCKTGEITWVNVTAAVVRNEDSSPNYLILIIEDINPRKQNEARIQYLAYFDQLTGLANRRQLKDHFNYSANLAKRSGEKLAIMFLDLDHFKNINDTLGHSTGDLLLIEVARRLKATLRDEDTLSRQGGDEFIVVLPNTDEQGAAHIAEKLLRDVAQPCQINQYELVTTVSIGIAIYPDDGQDLESLSKNADAAMYRAKQTTRNNFFFFTDEMQAHSARTLKLENALRFALERNQLQLHYQPQINRQDERVIGAEALLRWQHPEMGSISPAEFIPIAEDSGLIIPIGEWVLRTAVNQLKNWLNAGIPPMMISVNLSAVQFRHPNLPDMVSQILKDAMLPAEYLELELTEEATMDDPKAAISVMDKLHEHGIRMSIDDFGTGYSSLSYLKKFKVYKLKIDQSFVSDLSNDSDDQAIVTAIIKLAKSMKMKTIAEGVETASQLEFLSEQGCDEIQGYYFSKPLPTDQFEHFIKNKKQAASSSP